MNCTKESHLVEIANQKYVIDKYLMKKFWYCLLFVALHQNLYVLIYLSVRIELCDKPVIVFIARSSETTC